MKPFTRSPHPAGGVLRDAITVRVTDAGYEPDTVVVPAERRARIVSTRETGSPCAADVTFPDLGVSAKLPVGESVLVELPAAAGEHTFQCAMGMLRAPDRSRGAPRLDGRRPHQPRHRRRPSMSATAILVVLFAGRLNATPSTAREAEHQLPVHAAA